MYYFAIAWRQEFGGERRYGSGTVEVLIERIAELTAERDSLQREVSFVKDAPAAELPRLVSCALIIDEGLILLEKRAPRGIQGLDDHWDLPGGKVEAGETVVSAAVREIKEELDITVRPVSICGEPLPSTWIYPDRGPRHWCLVGVVCALDSGEPRTHERLKWFPVKQLPETIVEADRNLIQQYILASGGKSVQYRTNQSQA